MIKRKKKGFTLIELIVVIAILGILAAIAVPKLTGLRYSSQVSADGATATSIVNAARVQETETGTKVTSLVSTDAAGLQTKYMQTIPAPQSGGTFSIGGGGDTPYEVTWSATATGYVATQTCTEGQKFTPTTTTTP